MSEQDADDFDNEYEACGNGCEDGWIHNCIDGCCEDADIGCDLCTSRCDWCNPVKRQAQPAANPSTGRG